MSSQEPMVQLLTLAAGATVVVVGVLMYVVPTALLIAAGAIGCKLADKMGERESEDE